MRCTGNRQMPLGRLNYWIMGLALAASTSMVAASLAADNTSEDWIFDKARYSDNRTTGNRAIQYASPKPADRVPYAKYFSADGPHPFGFYPYYFHAPYLYYPYPYYAPDPLFNEMDPLYNGSF